MIINNFEIYWKELGRLDDPITANLNLENSYKLVAERAWQASRAFYEMTVTSNTESCCTRDGCGCE